MQTTSPRPNVRNPAISLTPLDAGQRLRPVEAYERAMHEPPDEAREIQGSRVLLLIILALYLLGLGLMGWMVWTWVRA